MEIDKGNRFQAVTRILETDEEVQNYARSTDNFTRIIKNWR